MRRRGQSALEYMLLLTVVAVVVLIALKPSSPTTVLNRAQVSTEQYYNKVSEVIMGKNPQPINGGWCPPKPSGQRECACPQPAFGGAPCVATSTIAYCGDGICGANETGEAGHPSGASDPLRTCYEDCDYLPDCNQCGQMVPDAACGGPCPVANCQGVEICMKSNCPAACPGFTQNCVTDAILCSGSCACDPGSWTPLGACGAPVGSCTPSWLEKCFQNNNCNSSCTPEQRLRPMPDPECGACSALTIPTACGSGGTATFPATPNRSTGTAICPAGCVAGSANALCTDGVFGIPEHPCMPDDCPSQTFTIPDCGQVMFPDTEHGFPVSIPCPGACTANVSALCNATNFENVVDSCIRADCGPGTLPTTNCGNIDLPGGTHAQVVSGTCPGGCVGTFDAVCWNGAYVNPINDQCVGTCSDTLVDPGPCEVTLPAASHNATSTMACPAGCTGGPINGTCNNGVFNITGACLEDCPNTPVGSGACEVTLPGTASGNTSSAPCPSGCTGAPTATCSNGTFTGISGTCLADCPDTPGMPAGGACGTGTMIGTTSGSVGTADCGLCSGTMTALCTNGTWGSVTNNCGCVETPVVTSCGSVNLPAANHDSPQTVPCPGACTGDLDAVCRSGDYRVLRSDCFASCPAANPSTAFCGPVTIPGVPHGVRSNAPSCGTGCTGTASAVCNDGNFGSLTEMCRRDCPAANPSTAFCGPVTIPGVPHGSSSNALSCGSGCTGTASAVCNNGNFGSFTETCRRDCADLTRSVSPAICGSVTFTGTAHNTDSVENCPGGCIGTLQARCTNGTFGPTSGSCLPPPTCTDGIQNQGEVGWPDCGGPNCPACTCTDRKKNQDEIGVDCGGSCPACKPCWDGGVVTTTYCGDIVVGGQPNGGTYGVACSAASSGACTVGSAAGTCDNGYWYLTNDICRRDCLPGSTFTTPCGQVTFSNRINHTATFPQTCPATCRPGTLVVQCNHGVLNALANCAPL